MAWTAPRTWVTDELVTAAMMNAHIRDNETELRAGGVAIASQAAQDFLYASSVTQLARLAAVSGKLPYYFSAAWRMQGLFRYLCDVFHDTSQTIGEDTTTALNMNSESFDPDAMHDPASNNNRVTVPEAGLYLAVGYTYCEVASGAAAIDLGLRRNGNGQAECHLDLATGNKHTVGVQAIVSLSASDYFELAGHVGSGGSAVFGNVVATLATRLIVAGPVV